MKYKLTIFVFLLLSVGVLGQHPDYKHFVYKYIEHKFDNYQTPEIKDALFILNGDTIQFAWDKDSIHGLGYAIPKERMDQKNNLRITHPDYRSLVLDSARMDWHFQMYLFQEGEEFYIENGIPVALNFGKKYIAVKVSKSKYSPKEAKDYVGELGRRYQLKIGVSYQDSILKLNEVFGEETSEKSYGGLEPELNYIFWLEKEDHSWFDNQSSLYEKIRKKKSIEWLGVPQDFNRYVLSDFEIEFKAGTDSVQINALIEEYKLEISTAYKIRREPRYILYTFKDQQLIPDNDLMRNLMKEAIINYVRPKKVIYDLLN
ncbi:MAG: hypothetical protein CMI36_12325 [Owenweeksia sp.]|nr:hypothetical protein [Owenweeksia sp.]MBF99770.1 hypothetical protein [Owenweeksia sp.]|tara:strand:- start:447 stop:1394 length:948 start_codon:yes stop_codon:yes gene_type:complete